MKDEWMALFSIEHLAKAAAIDLQKTNERSEKYGLTLTKADCEALLSTRERALSENGRVEIGCETLSQIARAFCDSAYLTQENYAETLSQLAEVFYCFKNETLDQIPDDELIKLMRDSFETKCGGSVELLAFRELSNLARRLRRNEREETDEEAEEWFEEEQ